MSRQAARSRRVEGTPGSHFASRSRSFGFGIVARVAPARGGSLAQLDVTNLLTAHDEAACVEVRVKLMQTIPQKLRGAEKALLVLGMKVVSKIWVAGRVGLVGSPPEWLHGPLRFAWCSCEGMSEAVSARVGMSMEEHDLWTPHAWNERDARMQ